MGAAKMGKVLPLEVSREGIEMLATKLGLDARDLCTYSSQNAMTLSVNQSSFRVLISSWVTATPQ